MTDQGRTEAAVPVALAYAPTLGTWQAAAVWQGQDYVGTGHTYQDALRDLTEQLFRAGHAVEESA
jgi:hypothetical protein